MYYASIMISSVDRTISVLLGGCQGTGTES